MSINSNRRLHGGKTKQQLVSLATTATFGKEKTGVYLHLAN
jgi:hypothetical protein